MIFAAHRSRVRWSGAGSWSSLYTHLRTPQGPLVIDSLFLPVLTMVVLAAMPTATAFAADFGPSRAPPTVVRPERVVVIVGRREPPVTPVAQMGMQGTQGQLMR